MKELCDMQATGIIIICLAIFLIIFFITYILIVVNPFKMKKQLRIKLEKIFSLSSKIIIITILSLFFLIPLLIVLAASLTDSVTFIRDGYSIIIKEFSLEAYIYVFKDPNILKGLLLSGVVTVSVTILSLFVNTLAAYALSEKEMPGHKILNGIFVFTLLFSTGMVPITLVVKNLGLYNTLGVLIIPAVINVYNILLIRNYLYTIPKSLKEAAIIDGASRIGIFFKVILPISIPIVATTGLMAFVLKWNSYMDIMYYIDKENTSLFTIQYIVMEMLTNFETSNGGIIMSKYVVQSATIIITIIPLMIIFPFLQKYFEKGLTAGSVKE